MVGGHGSAAAIVTVTDSLVGSCASQEWCSCRMPPSTPTRCGAAWEKSTKRQGGAGDVRPGGALV